MNRAGAPLEGTFRVGAVKDGAGYLAYEGEAQAPAFSKYGSTMGSMRFTLHERQRIGDEALERVYLAGSDETPLVGRAFFSNSQLVVESSDPSSACLWTPWPMGEHGVWQIGTSTLMHRDRPYQLEVELARGSVFRLRNQLAVWQHVGLQDTPEVTSLVADATSAFCRAASRQNDPAEAAGQAEDALRLVAEASIALAEMYAKQAFEARRSVTPRLPTLLGVRLNREPIDELGASVVEPLSLVSAPCSWAAIEPSEGRRRFKATDAQVDWARKAKMRVCAGPLIEFSDTSVPDWAYLWEGDFDSLSSMLVAHVEAVVRRYAGRVQLWNLAARINNRRVLSLSDEQRLQLVARAIHALRNIDPKSPVVVSLDQPWGEYMASDPAELTPVDFADALERADLGIAGFGLELNVGYAPDGTPLRNPLDFSRLLDSWSIRLEAPLMLMLTAPSSAEADKLAQAKPCSRRVTAGDAKVDAEFQAQWVEQTLPMMIAKNCVQVVIWNQHRDDRQHDFPHAGLIDADGKAKPVAETLKQLRAAHLA